MKMFLYQISRQLSICNAFQQAAVEKLESCWFELTITVKGNLFRALHGLWFFSEILTVFMLKLVEI